MALRAPDFEAASQKVLKLERDLKAMRCYDINSRTSLGADSDSSWTEMSMEQESGNVRIEKTRTRTLPRIAPRDEAPRSAE